MPVSHHTPIIYAPSNHDAHLCGKLKEAILRWESLAVMNFCSQKRLPVPSSIKIKDSPGEVGVGGVIVNLKEKSKNKVRMWTWHRDK